MCIKSTVGQIYLVGEFLGGQLLAKKPCLMKALKFTFILWQPTLIKRTDDKTTCWMPLYSLIFVTYTELDWLTSYISCVLSALAFYMYWFGKSHIDTPLNLCALFIVMYMF